MTTEAKDFLLIEAVLHGLWAPRDGDPLAIVEALPGGDGPTINDVIRARRALDRLRRREPRDV